MCHKTKPNKTESYVFNRVQKTFQKQQHKNINYELTMNVIP